MNSMDYTRLKSEFETELFDRVLPFWEKHSIDSSGGYFSCLSRNGTVYDGTKYMWLHGRQIWMFSKLYRLVEKRERWLEIATHGYEFMRMHAVTPQGRVYFSLNENGDPVYLQRKLFSECFYAIALAEYSRVRENESILETSKQTLKQILKYKQDPTLLDRPKFKGEPCFSALAIPMIILNTIEEIYEDQFQEHIQEIKNCIDEIKKHYVGGIVYENVLRNGTLHNSSAGLLLNPGHAIEAGWFMKHWARKLGDDALHLFANEMIRSSFMRGWDDPYGGIFYFLDARGCSPTQLEWDMKLWWPHCEALYAFLLLYSESGKGEDLKAFQMIKDYTFSHFPDQQDGEWFGYLNRRGEVTMDFKGGPYKGCFHVPRALYLCIELLTEMEA